MLESQTTVSMQLDFHNLKARSTITAHVHFLTEVWSMNCSVELEQYALLT